MFVQTENVWKENRKLYCSLMQREYPSTATKMIIKYLKYIP